MWQLDNTKPKDSWLMYESVHNYQEEPYRIPIPGILAFPGFRSCDHSAGNGLPGWVGFGRCFLYFRKLA